jgi:seryl-tRNA synthetase
MMQPQSDQDTQEEKQLLTSLLADLNQTLEAMDKAEEEYHNQTSAAMDEMEAKLKDLEAQLDEAEKQLDTATE